jgi:predicted kinase
MSKVLILRGIPGSGKTTVALEWLEGGWDRARINRDEIRATLFNKEFNVDERLVTHVESNVFETLLKQGYDVVVDNTNVRWTYVQKFADVARSYGYEVEVQVIDVPLDMAIQRNYLRAANGGRLVPVDVIERMHSVLSANKHLTL